MPPVVAKQVSHRQFFTLIMLQSILSARNRIYPFKKSTEDQRQLNKVKKYFKSKINVQKVC